MNRRYSLICGLLVVLTVLLSVSGRQALGAPIAEEAFASGLTTPQLIDQAHKRGEISADQRLLLLAYALFDHTALPQQYRGTRGWYGTRQARDVQLNLFEVSAEQRSRRAPAFQREVDRVAAMAATVCGENDGTTTLQGTNFFLNYTTIGGGMTAQAYINSLEGAFATEVTSYGWGKPPVTANNPHQKYPVQAVTLDPGLYGYVAVGEGNYTGLIGNNPNTPATETDSLASCMALNNDFSPFPGTTQAAMDATTAHEFLHSIQYGYGDPGVEEDGMWYESPATYAEDEVYDTANDNYNYLWPSFNLCLGENDEYYSNWIFFRYAAEHNGGTNVAGGGEDINQRMLENIAAGQQQFTAYNNALVAEGTTLADVYHDYAISTRSPKACTAGNTTHCYEEAANYISAAGTNANNGAIATVGGSYNSSLQNNYALHWVGLPSSGTYGVRLNNTTTGGQFRVSVVADMGSSLQVTSFPSVISGNSNGQLSSYTVPQGATSVFAVITNQQQTSANPSSCTGNAYQLQTMTASTPTTHGMTVTKDGTGTGTVSSNPSGISCGVDCNESFNEGTNVTLTATPAVGSVFAGWSGACSGVTPTCNVSMSQARSVTATFNELIVVPGNDDLFMPMTMN